MKTKPLAFHITKRTVFPLLLFLLGIAQLYYIALEDFSFAMIIMMMGLILYVGYNIISNKYPQVSYFNQFIEDMALFITFGVPTILFGAMFYKETLLFGFVVFYALTIILNMGRNWVLDLKNTCGWPIALNGLFFPLLYYFYIFYGLWESVFFFYYIIVGMLTLSDINFLQTTTKAKQQKEKTNTEHFNKNQNIKPKSLSTKHQEPENNPSLGSTLEKHVFSKTEDEKEKEKKEQLEHFLKD